MGRGWGLNVERGEAVVLKSRTQKVEPRHATLNFHHSTALSFPY